ncbi:hypothetical protein ACIBO2_24345 [Nonomuraea sp. NPDC050022]|uniref:hypothetical protein n=1 Tax=Nonomuraea sp. NPDC050022 TaxID=3364358 RepID=UPI00378B216C
MGSASCLEASGTGGLLIESRRYGNSYASDGHRTDRLTVAGQVPIVHLGAIADICRSNQPGL